jgi:hypothetical protein
MDISMKKLTIVLVISISISMLVGCLPKHSNKRNKFGTNITGYNYEKGSKWFDTEILRELKGVRILLVFTNDIANLLSIDKRKLKSNIETQLSNSGINVYKTDSTEFYLTGRPEIQIDIHPQHFRNADSIDYSITTSFVLTVKSFTNPKITNRVPITYWRQFRCDGSTEELFELLKLQLSDFINKVCRSNKGEICKG